MHNDERPGSRTAARKAAGARRRPALARERALRSCCVRLREQAVASFGGKAAALARPHSLAPSPHSTAPGDHCECPLSWGVEEGVGGRGGSAWAAVGCSGRRGGGRSGAPRLPCQMPESAATVPTLVGALAVGILGVWQHGWQHSAGSNEEGKPHALAARHVRPALTSAPGSRFCPHLSPTGTPEQPRLARAKVLHSITAPGAEASRSTLRASTVPGFSRTGSRQAARCSAD